jgi:transmembrane sensor
MLDIAEQYWDLAGRVLSKEARGTEVQQFESWLAEDERRQKWFAELEAVWAATNTLPISVDENAAWVALEKRIDARKQTAPARPPTPRNRRARRWVAPGVVAGALVAIVALFVVFFPGDQVDAPVIAQEQTVETLRGERTTVTLVDGSTVMLNVASRLSVAEGFGQQHRHVILEGEAVFDVAANTGLPFVVETMSGRVEVTGTRFVVREYRDEAFLVAVDEGTVTVGAADAQAAIGAGWLAWRTGEGLESARYEEGDAYFGWTQGRLIFRDERLGDVLARIERWHDVELRIVSPELAARRITTNFEGNTIDEVLDVVTIAIGARVTREGGVYLLYAEGR